MSDKEVVISYISRQSSRRHLLEDDHAALVEALEEMTKKHGWELNVVQAEKLSKENQLAIAARTTVRVFLRSWLYICAAKGRASDWDPLFDVRRSCSACMVMVSR